MYGEWVREPKNGASLVFVHGILSSGETCWRHGDGAYWPDLLKSEVKFEEWGIYVYTYETGVFSGTYSLNDVVDDLKEHLFHFDKVAESRHIVFVCHSMGGIAVRKLLVERVNDFLDRNIEIGLFLVASPSLGASYANWLKPLAKLVGHAQGDILRFSQHNTWLNGLDKEFRNLKESNRLKIRGKELIEDKFVVLKKIIRKQVVEPFAGAHYFGEPYKIPGSDHFSIAKPENSEAKQHKSLLIFLEESASKPTDRQHEPKSSIVETPATETNYEATTSAAIGVSTPGNPLPPDHPSYIRREADDRIDNESSDYGETFIVKAAEEMGKTSLLLRYLALSETSGKKTALIDFRPFLDSELSDLSVFLSRLAGLLLDQLGCNPALAKTIRTCHGFTEFVDKVILQHIDAPIVLAFDNVDRLIDQE